jgi:hypothetical protein
MGEGALNVYLRMCIGRPLDADISAIGTRGKTQNFSSFFLLFEYPLN